MPLYDYQCEHCKLIFEVRASFQEKEKGLNPECPDCHSTEMHQVLTAGLFVRPGNGDGSTLPSSNCGPNAGFGCCG